MKRFPLLILALTALPLASAARLPGNLEPFGTEHVCAGRAEVLLRGQADTSLTSAAQATLEKLAASLKLNPDGENYTACPAWLYFKADAGNTADNGLVYSATLSLVTPKLDTKALENLKSESFDYDGGFEYVALWSDTGYNTAFSLDNLSFKLKAEVVSQMGDFTADWNRAHP